MAKKGLMGIIVLICIFTVYLAFRGGPAASPKIAGKAGVVGIIRVEGVISGAGGGGGVWGIPASSLDQIMAAIKAARDREEVKAVVIRIDSPGGTVAASQEIGEEIDKLRKTGKPVIASMGDVAASGGYWVACSCDQIVANPGSLTGSIGVIMELQNYEELFKKLGIRAEVIKSGALKDVGSAYREMTPEERKILEGMVKDSYQQFVSQVKKGRQGRIDENQLEMIMDGRIFTGRQAQQLGLVDKLGNFPDAIQLAKKESGLKTEPYVEELNRSDPLNRLFSYFSAQYRFGNQSLLKAVF